MTTVKSPLTLNDRYNRPYGQITFRGDHIYISQGDNGLNSSTGNILNLSYKNGVFRSSTFCNNSKFAPCSERVAFIGNHQGATGINFTPLESPDEVDFHKISSSESPSYLSCGSSMSDMSASMGQLRRSTEENQSLIEMLDTTFCGHTQRQFDNLNVVYVEFEDGVTMPIIPISERTFIRGPRTVATEISFLIWSNQRNGFEMRTRIIERDLSGYIWINPSSGTGAQRFALSELKFEKMSKPSSNSPYYNLAREANSTGHTLPCAFQRIAKTLIPRPSSSSWSESLLRGAEALQ